MKARRRPTVADLERKVVDAAVGWKRARNGNLEFFWEHTRKLDEVVARLLRAREEEGK